jgi:TATA-binding protein-associated factor
MDTRLDSLFALLGKDSSPAARKAAAQQIGEVQKSHPYDLQNLLERAHFYLRSPHWDTRIAASQAIEAIVSHVPRWDASKTGVEVKSEVKMEIDEMPSSAMAVDAKPAVKSLGRLTFERFDVQSVMENGTVLLASSGVEFDRDAFVSSPEELARQRQQILKALDLKPEDETFIEDADLTLGETVEMNEKPRDASKNAEIEATLTSSRMRNQAKRKLKDAYNRPTPVPTPLPSMASDKKTKTVLTDQPQQEDKVVMEAVLDVDRAFEDVNEWPLERFCDELCVELFDKSWSVRHGAAVGLREVLKLHSDGAGRRNDSPLTTQDDDNRLWFQDCAIRLICVLMLDRFADFSSDQTIAHVREACAQVLGILFAKMLDSELLRILHILDTLVSESDQWEVRHGTFLALKYLIAVRPLFAEEHLDKLMELLFKGLADPENDVKAVTADALNPLLRRNIKAFNPNAKLELSRLVSSETCTQLLETLSNLLLQLDDVSSATNNVMILLSSLCSLMGEHPGLVTSLNAGTLIPILFPFFRHAIQAVRQSVLNMVETIFVSERSSNHLWLASVAPTLLQLLFQNFLLEEDPQIVALTLATWKSLLSQTSQLTVNMPVQVQLEDGSIAEQEQLTTLTSAIVTSEVLISWCSILSSPLGRPIDTARLLQVPFHNQASNGELGDYSSSGVSDRKIISSVCYENLCSALASFAVICREYNDVFVQIIQAMLTGLTGSERIAAAFFVSQWVSAYAAQRPNEATGAKEDPLLNGFPEALWTLMLDCASKWETQFYFTETEALMNSMRLDCKKLIKAFNDNGVQFDLGILPEAMTVDQGKELFNVTFDKLLPHVKDIPKAGVLPSQELRGLRVRAQSSIEHLESTQHSLHITSTALIAGAVVSISHGSMYSSTGIRRLPPSLNHVLKPLLQALTHQADPVWQSCAANAIASLTHVLSAPKPRELAVLRVIALLYVDPSTIPALNFANDIEASLVAVANTKKRKTLSQRMTEDDIDQTSDQDDGADGRGSNGDSSKKRAKTDEAIQPAQPASQAPVADASSVSTNGPSKDIGKKAAELTLVAMARTHGETLWSDLPTLLAVIQGPLQAGSDESAMSKACLMIMTLAPHVHTSLKRKLLDDLIPLLVRHVQSSVVSLRALAAQAIASIVRYTAPQSMNVLVTHVLPVFTQNAENGEKNVNARRGAALTLHACIATLELDVLPYLIFLIVPVLGRMSDQDDIVRKTMSFSFATLVKLMPLEARVPNPADMPAEMAEQRQRERVFLEQLLGGKKIDSYEMPIKINTDLRAYQQDGVSWLAFLNKYNLHGILADDMGLGKTLQTICILNSDHVFRQEQFSKSGGKALEFKPLPALVVCPPILVQHWENEVRRFCEPGVSVVQYGGTAADRELIRSNAHRYHLIVMSYETLRKNIESLTSIQFNYCVLDEGHIIRNPKAKITQAVKAIKANHRLILTGTPIQNNVLELWSLFDFLMPGFLGSERQFMSTYSKPVMASRDSKASVKEQEAGTMALEALHRQVLPFILRRMKEDVLHDLPPKIIQDVNVELSPLQLKLYNEFSKNNAPGEDDDSQHVFQSLQYLRKLVSHPKLVVTPTHPKYAEVCTSLQQEGSSLDDYTLSPKLVALKELLLDCGIGHEKTGMDAGITQNRVLIFAQLKQMLDIVEKDLFKKHMPFVSFSRLDGDVPTQARMPIVERFNANPSIDVLLLTVSVGGLGLNLTGANTVIFLEHDWNPQNDIQAMDRVHRIGQKKTVNVYRLITKGTLEEKIMGLQRFKLQIANTIVNKENQSFQSMDTSQLLDLFNVADTDKKAGAGGSEGVDQLGNVVAGAAPNSQAKGLKGLLDSLEELGDASRYAEEYNLDSLLSQIH